MAMTAECQRESECISGGQPSSELFGVPLCVSVCVGVPPLFFFSLLFSFLSFSCKSAVAARHPRAERASVARDDVLRATTLKLSAVLALVVSYLFKSISTCTCTSTAHGRLLCVHERALRDLQTLNIYRRFRLQLQQLPSSMTETNSPISGDQTPGDYTLDLDASGTSTPVLKRSRGRPRRLMSDESENEGETPTATRSKKIRTRGDPKYIPKSERISASVVPDDAILEPHQIVDDETVLSHLDQEGERKVDENGHLFGNREYRVRTFTVLGRGQRLYMLSTEPARCQGYRDSYLFFIRHKTLHKIVLDENEKQDLADRELVPSGYKTRHIAVCTARSVFREFGAKIIIGGRRIRDDYWVKEYQSQGYYEGVLADPEDKLPPPGIEYNKNQYVAWHGASSVYHREPQFERRSTRRAPAIDDANWVFAHAQAVSQYNSELGELRRRMLQGVNEPHTSLHFLPGYTQSERWTRHDLEYAKCEAPSSSRSTTVEFVMQVQPAQDMNLALVRDDTVSNAPEVTKAAVSRHREAFRSCHIFGTTSCINQLPSSLMSS